MNRRAVLCRVALSASSYGVVLTAGCLSDEPDPVAIGEIEIRNSRETAVSAELAVTKNGSKMLEETYSLDSRDGTVVDAVTIQEPWMGDTAEYELIITVDSTETETFNSQEFASEVAYPYECTPLNIEIAQQDRIRILYSTSADAC